MKHHDPVMNLGLIGLGLLGTWVPSAGELQSIYFILLIGPAAWSCWGWLKHNVWPSIRDLISKMK